MYLGIQVNAEHVSHGESPWQDWYKNLLLLYAKEFTSLHPYCVLTLLIFVKAAILTSTLRIKWRTKKEAYEAYFFLCEEITSLSPLRKGHSEKLLAVICMLHKVHWSHRTLKALSGSQSTISHSMKISIWPLVYVFYSEYMSIWSGNELWDYLHGCQLGCLPQNPKKQSLEIHSTWASHCPQQSWF